MYNQEHSYRCIQMHSHNRSTCETGMHAELDQKERDLVMRYVAARFAGFQGLGELTTTEG